jgi:hypothetical protein
MELASMLADEFFSDHPDCVCPVLAEFLRTYNDEVRDRLRQDLYGFAALSVGTNKGRSAETMRTGMCLRWWAANDPWGARRRSWLWKLGLNTRYRRQRIAEGAARWAAESPDRHPWAMELATELAQAFGAGVETPKPVMTAVIADNGGIQQGYKSPQTQGPPSAPAGLELSRS